MTLDIDETGKVNYCACTIKDGKLVIVFNPKNIGVNISDALGRDSLSQALNAASVAAGDKLSFMAKDSIRKEWEPKVEGIQEKYEMYLGKKLKMEPNFEENYVKCKEESEKKKTQIQDGWERSFGYIIKSYFEGLQFQLDWQKFEDDEMMQEGFFDAVDKETVSLRLVDKLKKSNYCDCVIEDGVLYIQALPSSFGSNVNDACKPLSSLL